MYTGQPIRRREDHRLITGQGSYTDDLNLPGALHLAFVRSSHAHARIAAIDTKAALAMPGVQAMLTGADLAGLQPSPLWFTPPAAHIALGHAMAKTEVRFVGEARTVAAPPAIVNAVLDALAPLGVTDLNIPLTPPKVWAAIQSASPQ